VVMFSILGSDSPVRTSAGANADKSRQGGREGQF